MVFELVTGKDCGITEWISDNVIDKAVEAGEKVVEVVSDGVEEVWD